VLHSSANRELITRFANLYRTPSQFYRDLKKVAPSSVSDDFVLVIWKDHLPTNMQYVLTALRVTKANALIRVAHTNHDIRPEPGQIAAASEQTNCASDKLTR
jgi:hypothetical protein